MIILGLDPGLAKTGYGIIQKRGSALVAREWGVIATEKNPDMPRRLQVIARDLKRILMRCKPALAVVESVYFAKNTKTAILVAQARGAILLTLQNRRVKILELTPLQMKAQITSYGTAPKSQVQTMVQKLLKLKTVPRPDDAADALALALCGGL